MAHRPGNYSNVVGFVLLAFLLLPMHTLAMMKAKVVLIILHGWKDIFHKMMSCNVFFELCSEGSHTPDLLPQLPSQRYSPFRDAPTCDTQLPLLPCALLPYHK